VLIAIVAIYVKAKLATLFPVLLVKEFLNIGVLAWPKKI
jgi:hypothetical protein